VVTTYAVVELDEIELDDTSTQSRVGLNQDTVARYTEMWDKFQGGEGETPFDSDIELFYDGDIYWIGAGWHRTVAAKESGKNSIPANINDGNKDDAIAFSCGQDVKCGTPKTLNDRRKSVRLMLEVRPEWSVNRIATHCGVSHYMVQRIKDGDGIDDSLPERPEPVSAPANRPPRPSLPVTPFTQTPDEEDVVEAPAAAKPSGSLPQLADIDAQIEGGLKRITNLIDSRANALRGRGQQHMEYKAVIQDHLAEAYSQFQEWREE
jgi:hypothetical protein